MGSQVTCLLISKPKHGHIFQTKVDLEYKYVSQEQFNRIHDFRQIVKCDSQLKCPVSNRIQIYLEYSFCDMHVVRVNTRSNIQAMNYQQNIDQYFRLLVLNQALHYHNEVIRSSNNQYNTQYYRSSTNNNNLMLKHSNTVWSGMP